MKTLILCAIAALIIAAIMRWLWFQFQKDVMLGMAEEIIREEAE